MFQPQMPPSPPLVACATGHRPQRFPWKFNELDDRCVALKQQMDSCLWSLYQRGYLHFITGMALGTDLYFAEAVLRLQQYDPSVCLEAAIPHSGQEKSWGLQQQERYYAVRDACQIQRILQSQYSRGCMHQRNRYMVDHSHSVICVYDGSPQGGTAQTVRYAQKCQKELIYLSIPQ